MQICFIVAAAVVWRGHIQHAHDADAGWRQRAANLARPYITKMGSSNEENKKQHLCGAKFCEHKEPAGWRKFARPGGSERNGSQLFVRIFRSAACISRSLLFRPLLAQHLSLLWPRDTFKGARCDSDISAGSRLNYLETNQKCYVVLFLAISSLPFYSTDTVHLAY